MDNDDLRRGKPTVHKAFGEAEAVLAGDSLHALAFEILAHPATHEDPHVRSDLVFELARAAGPGGMAGGQMMDLVAEGEQLDIAAITRSSSSERALTRISRGADHGPPRRAARTPSRGYARNIGWRSRSPTTSSSQRRRGAAGKRTGKDAPAGKATFVSLWARTGLGSRAFPRRAGGRAPREPWRRSGPAALDRPLRNRTGPLR